MKVTKYYNKLDETFRKNMRAIRRFKEITTDELAKSLDISPSQLNKYEKGSSRITIGRAYDIANALKVDIKELLDIT